MAQHLVRMPPEEVSIQEETLGQTQDTLEILFFLLASEHLRAPSDELDSD